MASPILQSFPEAPEEKAIGVIRMILETAPTLENVTLWFPDGERIENQDFEPEWDHLPLIRCIDDDYASVAETESTHTTRLLLRFQLYTLGTHYADRFRLWKAFVTALFPTEPDRLSYVRSAVESVPSLKARNCRLVSAGTATKLIGSDHFARVSEARLILPFNTLTMY